MRRLVVLALGSLGLLGACSDTRTPETTRDRQLAVAPPIQSASIYGNELSVKLVDGVKLGDVVDMSVFGQFEPDVPITEVQAKHGKPESERTDHRGRFYTYNSPKAKVEIAHEQSSSGVGDATWTKWAVYAYPAETTASKLFHEALLKQLATVRPGQLLVMTKGRERLLAKLQGDKIEELRWFRVSQ